MDVLNRKTWIGLVEPDRSATCFRRKIYELLEGLSAWRGRRVLGEFEYEIEDLSNVLGEVGDLIGERTAVDRKKPDLVIIERNNSCEMPCDDLVQVFRRSATANSQDQLDL